MGLRFTWGTNVARALENLCQYVLVHPDLFTIESFSTDPATSSVDLDIFQHGKLGAGGKQPMPKRYRFSANSRTVLVVYRSDAVVGGCPRIGYALTYHGDQVKMPSGVRLPHCIPRHMISS